MHGPYFSHTHTTAPQAWDFERLYTNLPHALLCTALAALINASLATTPFIRSNTTAPPPHKLRAKPSHNVTFHATRPGPRYSARNNSVSRVFTRAEFVELLDSLLTSTFIAFGPALVRQICGIPMGISAAPFIANLFLGWCEYRFLMQRYLARVRAADKRVLTRC